MAVSLTLLLTAACSSDYDDSGLKSEINNLDGRLSALEQQVKSMNGDITSIRTIVTALQNNDYITDVTPLANGSGYEITFAKAGKITIRHGSNGKDGVDGKAPAIGIQKDTDGIYYWTLDGKFILVDGKKVKAEGQNGKDGADGHDGAPGTPGAPGADGTDGITPLVSIIDGYWHISYDNGATWGDPLGKAIGEDGKDGQDGQDGLPGGDSIFENINTDNPDYVIITMTGGNVIKIPTWAAFDALSTLCAQTNSNLTALQAIVDAMQSNKYITSVEPFMENGNTVGQKITFSDNSSVVIYNGKDGADGADGVDGTPGAAGHTPNISIKQDTDGIYYWTLDGTFILVNGQKVKAQGTDGQDGNDAVAPQLEIRNGYWHISYDGGESWTSLNVKAAGEDGAAGVTPQLKIGNDNYWYVSYDEGATWTSLAVLATGATGAQGTPGVTPKLKIQDGYWYVSFDGGATWESEPLGQATGNAGADGNDGADGADGDALFQGAPVVDDDAGTVTFTLADGTSIVVPKYIPLKIAVTEGLSVTLSEEESAKNLHYTVTGGPGAPEVSVYCSVPLHFSARINPASGGTSGTLFIQVGNAVGNPGSCDVILVVKDGAARAYAIVHVKMTGLFSNTIHVETAGTLGDLLTASQQSTLTNLTVTGYLNDDDITTLNNMPLLATLDLKDAMLTANTLKRDAFKNKTTLTSVKLPSSLENIEAYAFRDCTGLTGNLTLPVTLKKIDGGAFLNCSNISGTLIIPANVSALNSAAFSGCSGFTGLEILSNKITTIQHSCFNGCTSMTGTLTLPSSLEYIINRAFNQTQFTKIILGNSVKMIGNEAFAGNTTLNTSVTFPASVSLLNESCFEGNTKMTGVTLGENLTQIGVKAFNGCSSLTGNLVIPDKVGSIGDSAFANTKIPSLTLGSGVKTIGTSAFKSAVKGGTLIIPAAVTSVGASAFEGCAITGLTVNSTQAEFAAGAFKNGVNSTGGLSVGGQNTIRKGAFEGCKFKNITLTGEATVDEKCFEGYTLLTGQVSIDAGVNLGDHAFSGCPGFPSIKLNTGVTKVPNYAFYGCTGVTTLTIASTTLQTIGNCAFSDTQFTNTLTITESVASIGVSAFDGCNKFKTLTIEGAVQLQWKAFKGCTGIIGTVTLPEGTQLGESVFEGCTGITGLGLPTSWQVTYGEKAFKNCTNLTNIVVNGNTTVDVTVGTGMTTIPKEVFYGCKKLKVTTLRIAEGVQTIGDYAFCDCMQMAMKTGELTRVTSVYLPSTLTEIGTFALAPCGTTTDHFAVNNHTFQHCYSLAATPPTLGAKVFSKWTIMPFIPNSYQKTYLYVPGASYLSYKNSDWGTQVFQDTANQILEYPAQ